jgi:hypothetical protein
MQRSHVLSADIVRLPLFFLLSRFLQVAAFAHLSHKCFE